MGKSVSAAIIQKGKILVLKQKGTWILPGGEYEDSDNKSSLDYLNRKIKEELPSIELVSKVYYKSFERINKKSKLEMRVYLAVSQGNEKITGIDISESKWIKAEEVPEYNLSDITKKVIISLKKDRYFGNKEEQGYTIKQRFSRWRR